MPTPKSKTDLVIASRWSVHSGYVFAELPKTGKQMVTDDQDDRLEQMPDKIRQIAESPLMPTALGKKLLDLAYDLEQIRDTAFVTRMRGYGAGLDQEKILEYIVDTHNRST